MECFKKYKLLRVKINIVKVMVLISDLVRIAAAGGGLRIDCNGKMVSDLIRIAVAGSARHSIIVLENYEHILVSDRIRISAAGQGCIFFNDIV